MMSTSALTVKLVSKSIAIHHHRGLSTVNSAGRLVLSRHAWQSHAQKLPKKQKLVKEKPEDKPWPKNVQIGAGVAACIFIPYTAVWLITSNATLRDICGPYLPLDWLRSHFGELEWDVQSYADAKDTTEIPDCFYQYPLEPTYRDRLQQRIVEEAEKDTLTANIYVLGDSQRQEVRKVPASTQANPRTLAELAGIKGASNLAVDFVSETGQDSASDLPTFDERSNRGVSQAEGLLKRMHTFSTWHYTPAMGSSAQKQNSSDNDIERLRLEYTVEKLEKDLRDPLCTRDHDVMRTELSQAKRDLSRAKWKSRLGL